MTGACIIDGVDIASLGAFILRGGDNDFISYPSRKEPDSNDWPELDGIEISGDDPVFNEKKLTVKYYLKGSGITFKSNLSSFFNLNMQQGYRSIYVREFDKTFQLRFAEVSGYDQNRGFSLSGEKKAYIDIDYMMDDPLQFLDSQIINPVSGRDNSSQVTVNGIDLADYGIIVNNIYPTAMKLSAKTGLIIKSEYTNGIIVDIGSVPKRQKQAINIECTMIAPNKESFMINYNALWNAISGVIVNIGLPAASLEFDCYYSGMSGFNKRPWTDRVKVSFNLEFTGNVFTV